ncbi:MAG: hypothetical protein AMXMBFR47_13330 [Planctomycetota bacterium]
MIEQRETVAGIVRQAISETCGCNMDVIRPDALLFDLTDDNSLELLDLEFRLGKALRTPIELGKPLTADFATEPGGELSAAYLQTLRLRYPFLPFDRLPPNPKPSDLPRLLTVDAITALVELQVSEPRMST